jgi:hypothetical protein
MDGRVTGRENEAWFGAKAKAPIYGASLNMR